jgi:hypothetical protein
VTRRLVVFVVLVARSPATAPSLFCASTTAAHWTRHLILTIIVCIMVCSIRHGRRAVVATTSIAISDIIVLIRGSKSGTARLHSIAWLIIQRHTAVEIRMRA